jgi:hypothetical protein
MTSLRPIGITPNVQNSIPNSTPSLAAQPGPITSALLLRMDNGDDLFHNRRVR